MDIGTRAEIDSFCTTLRRRHVGFNFKIGLTVDGPEKHLKILFELSGYQEYNNTFQAALWCRPCSLKTPHFRLWNQLPQDHLGLLSYCNYGVIIFYNKVKNNTGISYTMTKIIF